MFADPHEMVNRYYDDLRRKQEKDEYLEDLMNEHKKEAVKILYRYVDPFIAEAIAGTIAYAYENEVKHAIDIVNKLPLNDKHMAALNNDPDRIWEIILKEVREEEYYDNLENY